MHLDAKAEEYTDDLKVKWYGYENRGRSFLYHRFQGPKITLTLRR